MDVLCCACTTRSFVNKTRYSLNSSFLPIINPTSPRLSRVLCFGVRIAVQGEPKITMSVSLCLTPVNTSIGDARPSLLRVGLRFRMYVVYSAASPQKFSGTPNRNSLSAPCPSQFDAFTQLSRWTLGCQLLTVGDAHPRSYRAGRPPCTLRRHRCEVSEPCN